ncbi:MAG: hypothetical protein ABWY63_14200 [Hyphomicrobiaceae bacterium]
MSTMRYRWSKHASKTPLIDNLSSRVKAWVRFNTFPNPPTLVTSWGIAGLTDAAVGYVGITTSLAFATTSNCGMRGVGEGFAVVGSSNTGMNTFGATNTDTLSSTAYDVGTGMMVYQGILA